MSSPAHRAAQYCVYPAPLEAFADVQKKQLAFTLHLGRNPMLGRRPMKICQRDTTEKCHCYMGKFHNGAWFKLLVPCTDALTDQAASLGVRYIVSLYVGDYFTKELRGNYFVFDTQDQSNNPSSFPVQPNSGAV